MQEEKVCIHKAFIYCTIYLFLTVCKLIFLIIFAGIFPEPNHDPVIQIANMVVCQGDHEPFLRNIFTLKSCAPILGSQVISFESEDKLLEVYNLI